MSIRKLAIPFTAMVLAFTLSDSPAQPPKGKAKGDDRATATAMIFECYKDNGGSFRYRIKEGDTTIGMASKGYDTMAECKKICETIQKGAAKSKIVEAKDDK